MDIHVKYDRNMYDFTVIETDLIDKIIRILATAFNYLPNKFANITIKRSTAEDEGATAYHFVDNEYHCDDLQARYFGRNHEMVICIDRLIEDMDRVAKSYWGETKKALGDYDWWQAPNNIIAINNDIGKTVLTYVIVHEIMHSLVFTDNAMMQDEYISGVIFSYSGYRKTVEMLVDIRAVEFIKAHRDEISEAISADILDPILQLQLDQSRENISTPFCLGTK